MGILSILGSGAFAAACVNFTIDAFQRSHRPFNLIGCLLIDTGYCLFIYDNFSLKTQKGKNSNDIMQYLEKEWE